MFDGHYFEPLTAFVDSVSDHYGIPACDLIVFKDGREVYRHLAGFSDAEGKIPASENDLYRLYSATKIATCTAALRLVEDGVLSLDDPVSKYLPAYADLTVKQPDGSVKPAENVMTVRHLFTMTGGLDYDSDRGGVKRVIAEKGDKAGTIDICSAFVEAPLDFEPGTHYQYSLCHDVLGAVVEAASGMRFGDYLKKVIFDPLGMKDTCFALPEDQLWRVSEMRNCDPETWKPIPAGKGDAFRFTPNYESGGGGLTSSAYDYALFAAALANKGTGLNGYRLLKPETSFKLLIDNLWPDDDKIESAKTKTYSPNEFKEKISTMNPLFKGIAANDSKDLVNFIIMTLHNELNNNNNLINEPDNIIIDQTNQQMVFNCFIQEFMAKNHSIISDLFYSVNCNVTQCTSCNTKIYNYQTYFFINFPLEEIRKFKNNMQNNFIYNNYYGYNNYINYNNNNEVNIYDCFEHERKINYMNGENSMYCNYCKTVSNSMMYTYLVTSPEILVLILNRGKGIEFNVKINFSEELNLYNYIEYKNTGYKYKLIGVITHIGESSMSGHFIAYCYDQILNKWYKYNDAIVNEVSNFQNEVINFAMPYLLFYQKIDV